MTDKTCRDCRFWKVTRRTLNWFSIYVDVDSGECYIEPAKTEREPDDPACVKFEPKE